MSLIREITDAVISDAVWESDWYNADFESNSDKSIASNGTTPKNFLVQCGFDSIVGSPDGSSKIEIITTVRGQTETVYQSEAITADNLTDSFQFYDVTGNAFKIRITKGGITSYKLVADYDVVK
jgi:hypothetical protein